MNIRQFLIHISFVAMFLMSSYGARASELKVKVSPISSETGAIYCALFTETEDFPDAEAAMLKQRIALSEAQPECVFTNLDKSEYAVSVIYDADDNGKLNTNLLGIPTEDWGTSNNVRPSFRAPNFEEAAFKMESDMVISVELNH